MMASGGSSGGPESELYELIDMAIQMHKRIMLQIKRTIFKTKYIRLDLIEGNNMHFIENSIQQTPAQARQHH
jgi:hypothetical protein